MLLDILKAITNLFRHAWILFLKWGKTDLNFTENEIQVAFQKKIEKDLKLI